MPYSNDNDLLNEFKLEDLAKLSGDESGTAIQTQRTAHARSMADNLIDAYLFGIYSVPFVTTPELIKNI